MTEASASGGRHYQAYVMRLIGPGQIHLTSSFFSLRSLKVLLFSEFRRSKSDFFEKLKSVQIVKYDEILRNFYFLKM
jgi:hypothetical protein